MKTPLIAGITILVLVACAIGYMVSVNKKASNLRAEQSYLAVIASLMEECIYKSPEATPEALIDELCTKFNQRGHAVTISKCDMEKAMKGVQINVLSVRSKSQVPPHDTYAFAPVARRATQPVGQYIQVLIGPLGYEALSGDDFRTKFEIIRKIGAVCLRPRH